MGSSHLSAIYSPFVDLKVHGGLFGLFYSPRAGMRLHVREGIKVMIFILNQNSTSLSFKESWSFNNTRISFPKCLNHWTKSPFELIHTDIWVPSRCESTLGFRYFVTFIDDYS